MRPDAPGGVIFRTIISRDGAVIPEKKPDKANAGSTKYDEIKLPPIITRPRLARVTPNIATIWCFLTLSAITPPVRMPRADPIKNAVKAAVALLRLNAYRTCKADTPKVCIPINAAAKKVKKRKHDITVDESKAVSWLNNGSVLFKDSEFFACFSEEFSINSSPLRKNIKTIIKPIKPANIVAVRQSQKLAKVTMNMGAKAHPMLPLKAWIAYAFPSLLVLILFVKIDRSAG